jgi:predicted enzyme related to lactoylglutathione lyase
VDNADATCARIAALGGSAKPPFNIRDNLRMAVCFDPNGAEFDIWEPINAHGTDVEGRPPGAPSWYETMTTDATKDAKFYSDLFGWTYEKAPNAPIDYTVFKRGNEPIAGMMQITPEMGKMPPQWLTYFTVNDADEAARQAVQLGGKICMTMKEAKGVGRFCAITSPQGVMFYVIEYAK